MEIMVVKKGSSEKQLISGTKKYVNRSVNTIRIVLNK